MAATKLLRQYATRKATRRLTRAIPWIGGVIALVTLGSAIRRKGFVGGTVHTGLDFVPFVGTAKNLAEAVRGRDFIPDRPPRCRQASSVKVRPLTVART
jgi:putative toxin of predicted polymorphic toxin system